MFLGTFNAGCICSMLDILRFLIWSVFYCGSLSSSSVHKLIESILSSSDTLSIADLLVFAAPVLFINEWLDDYLNMASSFYEDL